jgi:hypothetical protein
MRRREGEGRGRMEGGGGRKSEAEGGRGKEGGGRREGGKGHVFTSHCALLVCRGVLYTSRRILFSLGSC